MLCMIIFALAYTTCEEREPRNSCPKWDSNLVPVAYEATSLSVAQLDLISIEQFKADRVLAECAITIYLYHVVDVVKYFVVYYILLTLSSQHTSFKISQIAKRYKYCMTNIHNISFCYIYHVVQ